MGKEDVATGKRQAIFWLDIKIRDCQMLGKGKLGKLVEILTIISHQADWNHVRHLVFVVLLVSLCRLISAIRHLCKRS